MEGRIQRQSQLSGLIFQFNNQIDCTMSEETKNIRIKKAASTLNIGISTIVKFLAGKGHVVESNPNYRLTQTQYSLLETAFQKERQDNDTALKEGMLPINFSDIDAYSSRQSYHKRLYPYQREHKTSIYQAWGEGKMSIMLQMPTGTGKTHLFASIIKDLQDYYYDKLSSVKNNRNNTNQLRIPKILVLVHRIELVEQIEETLTNKYKHVCGTVTGGRVYGINRNVIVASVQTLSRKSRLEQWEQNTKFDFIIIDEAHHSPADSYQRIRNTWPTARLLGVTATPYRLNHQPFTDTYDLLILSQPVYQFIEQGYLCNYEYYSIRPDSQMQYSIDHLKTDFDGDYDEHDMERLLNQDRIRAGILQTYERFARGKKGIVYTISREHNKMLAALFEHHGYRVAWIDSQTPKDERSHTVKQFRKGEIDIIFNVNIFSEGFDCPDVEFIQLARPTKSLAMYLQQVGRGFRICEGKDRVIFLDNVGLYNRFGLPSARRHWRYHFEGREDWVDDNSTSGNPLEEHEYHPRDLHEGNEEIQLVYTSIENPEDPPIPSETNNNEDNNHIIETQTMDSNKLIVEIDGETYDTSLVSKEEMARLLLKIEGQHNTGTIDTEKIQQWLSDKRNKEMHILYENLLKQGFTKEVLVSLLAEQTPIEEVKPTILPGLYVKTSDGTIIQEKKEIDTFIHAIRTAGVEKVFKARIPTLGRYLVSSAPHPSYLNRSFRYDGYYIIVNHSCEQKIKLLQEISDKLKLGWEIGKQE